MVDLVLEDASEEFLSLERDLVALEIEPADMDPVRTEDPEPQPGDGEAPLVVVPLPLGLVDLGVDQCLRPVSHVVDEDTLLHAHLGSGQSGSLGVVHRLDHVVDELREPAVDPVDLAGDLLEDRVAIGAHGVRRHRPILRDIAASSCSDVGRVDLDPQALRWTGNRRQAVGQRAVPARPDQEPVAAEARDVETRPRPPGQPAA